MGRKKQSVTKTDQVSEPVVSQAEAAEKPLVVERPPYVPAEPSPKLAGQSLIRIRGAREHNLRGVNVDLPRGRLICMTGVSGSGKSSLAFDTLFAEGQRRYVESLSSYARQFLGQLPKPDVDKIDGLSPAIAIQQKTAGRNPRSTVGTITEISDYLRVARTETSDWEPKWGPIPNRIR